MAEGIFRKMMQERGMEERVLCQSAGLSAVDGMPVSENAVAACREIGVDISEHTARRITGEELPVWDLYFPMSKTHGYILGQAGVPQTKIYIPKYIADPYGGDLEEYPGLPGQAVPAAGDLLRGLCHPAAGVRQHPAVPSLPKGEPAPALTRAHPLNPGTRCRCAAEPCGSRVARSLRWGAASQKFAALP